MPNNRKIEDEGAVPIHKNLPKEELAERKEKLGSLLQLVGPELGKILENLERITKIMGELGSEAKEGESDSSSLAHWFKVMTESKESLERELADWTKKAGEMQAYIENMK